VQRRELKIYKEEIKNITVLHAKERIKNITVTRSTKNSTVYCFYICFLSVGLSVNKIFDIKTIS